MTNSAKRLGLLASLTLSSAALLGGEPPVLEVYSDFQCPFCARMAAPIEQLRAAVGDQLRIEFKHFPLDFHKDAPLGHRASIAAGAQGKFWEMHDAIFANPRSLRREDLLGHARILELDLARFEADMDKAETAERVEQDRTEGGHYGVTGTPSLRLNGKVVSGAKGYAELRQLVEQELGVKTPAPLEPRQLSKGPASAPVLIEIFADLTGPLSFAALDMLDELLASAPDRYRVRFRNLTFDSAARSLHSLLMAAAAQDSFWPAVHILASGERPQADEVAKRLGLDAVRLKRDASSNLFETTLHEDAVLATKHGVRGAPAIIVGNKRLDGLVKVDELSFAIEANGAFK
jgi:protein-disulfide isomerase